ncbi:hypothetical protein NDU88_002454 [Pleurodeles waltl]|uniref:Uncharacterized protein n=1 Tax=Pleurodeles waltl TaxID=8319 RepID=A0AAV7UYX7_PLEWA|nr:hypothetical protein NDU88_002454 [Pleurodeles waltl]
MRPKLAEAPCPLWGLVRGDREQKGRGTPDCQEPQPHPELNVQLALRSAAARQILPLSYWYVSDLWAQMHVTSPYLAQKRVLHSEFVSRISFLPVFSEVAFSLLGGHGGQDQSNMQWKRV